MTKMPQSRFIPIAEHCQALAGAMLVLDDGAGRYVQPAEWLSAAAGIAAVSYEHRPFDTTSWMCGRASEFDDAHTDFLEPYHTALARFLYVWTALEAFITIVAPDIKQPKVKGYTTALHQDGADAVAFPTGYEAFLSAVAERLDEVAGSVTKPKRLRQELRKCRGVPTSGRGLRVVLALRNQFAHGGVAIPVHPEWAWDPGSQLGALEVEASTRLVLMTMQIDLRVRSCPSGSVVDLCGVAGLGRWPEECTAESLLSQLHLDQPDVEEIRLG